MRLRNASAIAAVLGAYACKRHEPAPDKQGVVVKAADAVPRSSGPIKIDGEWDEPDWSGRALRGPFRADGGELARPSSEIRLLHDDADLIIALYGADENIETTDAFDLSVGTLALHIDATGTVNPPVEWVHAAVDYDEGTLNNPKDDDEEWVVELTIPLAKVGLQATRHQPVRAARCDTPKDGVRRCGQWSGMLTAE